MTEKTSDVYLGSGEGQKHASIMPLYVTIWLRHTLFRTNSSTVYGN